MKLVIGLLKKYKMDAFLSPLFKLLEACFDLLVPIVVKSIIDDGIDGGGGVGSIVGRFFLLVALGFIGLGFAVCAQYFAARASVGAATDLRHSLFSHMQSFSYTNTDNVGTSTMITRITSDINQLQNGINMTLRLFLRSPIIVFGAAICAFIISPESAWVFCIIIPLLAIVVFGVILAGIPIVKRVQACLDRVTSHTRENLNGVRVIRAFNMQEREAEEFTESNNAHAKIQNFSGRISALMNPLTYVIVNVGIILIIRFASPQIDAGNMSQGELVAMYNYMTQILVELVKLANTIFIVTKALASAKRISAVFEVKNEAREGTVETVDVESGAPALEFCNVSLTYSGASAPALSGLDLTVDRGMTVGIIGGTGSGKTSLISLIPAFYGATCGEVKYFGQNVLDYKVDALRSSIGIVPQNAVLFSGTIRSNLLWGKENATDEEMWEALRLAQAEDFVRAKPCGLDEPVSQGGKNFSGGQRQRLTIARAIISRPHVLILDDSASALDLATDARLRASLSSLDYDPTVFIISQRTASIAHADKIIVLEDGESVGIGTHSELLSSCDVYREIYDSQFKGGEAE